MNFQIKKILLLIFSTLVLASCATQPQTAQNLPLIGHSYSKSKKIAYNRFGFDFDNTPVGLLNILSKEPTKFKVNIYIGNNQNCKFSYTKDPHGTKAELTKTGSFTAYLSGRNILLNLSCQGAKSNIDYKIIAYANGIEYDRIGNLSYLVARGLL